MGRKYEKGNVIELVIIGVLVLGVIGLLAWRFFGSGNTQTNSQQPIQTSQTSDNSSSSTQTKLVDGSIDSNFGTKLTFTYPNTWKYESSILGSVSSGAWQQIIKITSPSSKYIVQYDVGAGGGLGGMCVPEEHGTISKFSYDVVSGLPSANYVEMVYKNPNNGENPGFVGLMKTDTAKKLAVNNSLCDAYLAEVMSLSAEGDVRILGVTLELPSAKTPSEFSAALSGTEYDQAKAILLSSSH